MKTLICNCNETMAIDAPALSRALATTRDPDAAAGLETLHTTLCRREAGAFQRAARQGDDLLVACTQESRLFVELNEQTEGAPSIAERPIRFVNIREAGGWNRDVAPGQPDAAGRLTPKLAALIAMARLPEPDPVPVVTYRSGGRVLVIGSGERAVRAAALFGDALQVALLLTGGGRLPQQRNFPVHVGRVDSITGWLGAFEVRWTSSNPIDADLCTRCNACIDVCPEGAIDFGYQIDLERCRQHRDCVAACTAAAAIDFERPPQQQSEGFDLLLDLRESPMSQRHQQPQGYRHVPPDAPESALFDAVLHLRERVGEFEKPKFFVYKPRLCAHSRNERVGCSACIDVCSAEAIRSDASLKGKAGSRGRTAADDGRGGIVVEPHLCVGCGACTTVCPSGALSYATPGPADQGRRIRTALSTFLRAGGRHPALLLHSRESGAAAIEALGRAARAGSGSVRGLPLRVLPVDVVHTASVGIDLWLAAFAYGASQVWVLTSEEEGPQYRAALQDQMAVAEAILQGLGFAGEHLRIVDVAPSEQLDAALRRAPAAGVATPATFSVQADKRATLDLAIDHLLGQAPLHPDEIALPAADRSTTSPFGSLAVDAQRCTMCLACVGACPEAALLDNPDKPQLRFIEKNCVQCGLCASTCPEQAITLVPRLWLADAGKARKTARLLNEARPYACVRCGKPFGTEQAIESMLVKLAGHSMFRGAAAERLKMCADCRVIDLHSSPDEVRITDL